MGTDSPLNDALLRQVVLVLRGGGVILYPTETLVGLGGDATNAATVARIGQLKGRTSDKPFLVLMRDRAAIESRYGALPAAGRRLADAFWPGPLTLIIADQRRGGTIGVRVSPHPVVRQILGHFDRPLVSTSANLANDAPASQLSQVPLAIRSAVDLAIEFPCGAASDARPSSIVDVSGEAAQIVRVGAISRADLEPLLEVS